MIFQLLKSLLVITGTITGVVLAHSLAKEYPDWVKSFVQLDHPDLVLTALLGFIGYLLCSIFGRELQEWIEKQLNKNNSNDIAWSAVGFVLGLLCANLLLLPFYIIAFNGTLNLTSSNQYINDMLPLFLLMIPLCFNLLFAYLGIKITLKYRRFQDKIHINSIHIRVKIIDTSAALDGRFSDLFRLGFLEGNILIPHFVINELQLMSESLDKIKSSRGLNAIETINKLCSDFPDNTAITNQDFPEIPEIENRLLKLAKEKDATIITQDANLKKIAEIEQIPSLNLNDLSNAIKPVFLGGESIEINIIKRGKEAGQGVGFLTDGTMVVIEDGGNDIGKTVSAKVNNILQTGNGRIIFCRIGKNTENN